MENSTIEWTHHTFNPWRGCSRVSEGCRNCYAEKMSKRNPSVLGEWGTHGTRVIASEAQWKLPLKWNRQAAQDGARRRVFCASMADVFEDRPELIEPRKRLFNLIMETPHLDWLLLTKRPENIKPLLQQMPVLKRDNVYDHLWPHHFNNVWLGTSVEDQATANERIPELLKVPAALHFLSCEPLLGMVDLRKWLACWYATLRDGTQYYPLIDGEDLVNNPRFEPRATHTRPRVAWVIVGGESGPHARPMHPQWARNLRDQCQDAGVPFFFKQHGEYALSPWNKPNPKPAIALSEDGQSVFAQVGHVLGFRMPDEVCMERVGKKKAGRLLDGREHNDVPQVHHD